MIIIDFLLQNGLFGLYILYLITEEFINKPCKNALIAFVVFYSIPLALISVVDKWGEKRQWLGSMVYGLFLLLLVIFTRDSGQDFIYFQF